MRCCSLGKKPGINPSWYSCLSSSWGKALTDSVHRHLVSTQVDRLLTRRNIKPRLMVPEYYWVVPTKRLSHLRIFWLLPWWPRIWSWPVPWNHEGLGACYWCRYSTTWLLQFVYRARMIGHRYHRKTNSAHSLDKSWKPSGIAVRCVSCSESNFCLVCFITLFK